MANPNIMLYALKKDFDVQKAERFFKERGIKVQAVDMKKHGPGVKELRLFAQQAGLANIIDKESKLYKESTLQFLREEESILEALSKDPRFLKGPIVRMGQKVTVGYQPDVWKNWLDI